MFLGGLSCTLEFQKKVFCCAQITLPPENASHRTWKLAHAQRLTHLTSYSKCSCSIVLRIKRRPRCLRGPRGSWSSSITPLTSEQVQAEFTWNLLFLRMGAFAIGLKCTLTARDRQAPTRRGGGETPNAGKEIRHSKGIRSTAVTPTHKQAKAGQQQIQGRCCWSIGVRLAATAWTALTKTSAQHRVGHAPEGLVPFSGVAGGGIRLVPPRSGTDTSMIPIETRSAAVVVAAPAVNPLAMARKAPPHLGRPGRRETRAAPVAPFQKGVCPARQRCGTRGLSPSSRWDRSA